MVERRWSVWSEGWLDALAVLFPVDCAGCGAPDRALCAGCRTLLDEAEEGHLSERVLSDSTRVVSAVRYEGQLRQMILAFKEQGRTDVVKAFAAPLRAAIESAARITDHGHGEYPAGIPSDISRVEVCAVPSSASSQRRRGYRPVELMTRAAGFRLARVLALPSVAATGPMEQKNLDLTHRGMNLHGAFSALPSARGRKFVIVDDVVTSGATLCEAARALRAAGAQVVGAATFASTPRRNAHYGTISGDLRDIHSQGS